MAKTAFYSPAHRVNPRMPLGSGQGGPDQAPSFDFGGSGLLDPRLTYNLANSATGAAVIGWWGANYPKLISQAPAAAATANIAALANVVSGTKMTLVSSTGAGITVVPAGGFVPWPNYGITIPAGACAIDGLPGVIRMGRKSITAFYDPTKASNRCVSITGVSGGAGGNFLIAGWDLYGFPMTQLLTVGAGAVTANTSKAFKIVGSVTPQFTDAHNYSVGVADIFGIPIASDFFADTDITWNGVICLLATFTAAVTTSPATNLTGDVRGLFTPPNASDGTKRLDMFAVPSLARIANANPAVGLFGVAQA